MKKTFFFAAAILSLAACNKTVIDASTSEVGYLEFAVSAEDIVVDTRTVSEDALDAYDVILVGQWTKTYSEVKGQTFTLPAATYSLYAENINESEAEAGNGALRVASETVSHTVSANQTATANLSCVAQSSKLTLNYTDSFKGVFSNYTFKVSKSDNTARKDGVTELSLVEDVPVYYNGSVTLNYTITGTHNLNGVKTYGGQITVNKGHSLTVTVDQNSQSGGLGIVITANDELITDNDLGITVDPYNKEN